MKVKDIDNGKIIMFVPNINHNTGVIQNIPVKLNTKKLKDVEKLRNNILKELKNIEQLPIQERLASTKQLWNKITGNKQTAKIRKRTLDSSFDVETRGEAIDGAPGIGEIFFYEVNKNTGEAGFYTQIDGVKYNYLTAEDLINKLDDTRIHIPYDNIVKTLQVYPEIIETDLIDPQARGLDSIIPNVFMDTNVHIDSLPDRLDIVKVEQEKFKTDTQNHINNIISIQPKKRTPRFKISNESYSGEGAKNYIKDRFSEIGVTISNSSLEILKELYEVGDNKVWGAFHKAVVYLASDAGVKVGKHEAMHVLFNLFLNDKQKTQIYNELFKKYGKELEITKEEFNNQKSLLKLEEKLSDTFEDYKYIGILSEKFKKENPNISNFLEKIFKFLLDQYHMLKSYLTDSLTINDIFYQLDNNIFGKGYDSKRRKSYQQTFSRNLMEVYGEEAKFKVGNVSDKNVRKYVKFLVTDVFNSMLDVKDSNGNVISTMWLSDKLKNSKNSSKIINELFNKLPGEIDTRIKNAPTAEIKNSLEEIKSILNNKAFKLHVIAEIKQVTGYNFTIEEDTIENSENEDTNTESETGEYSESNVVKNLNVNPNTNIKGKLRELLNRIIKVDLETGDDLIDTSTGGYSYYTFEEVTGRLYQHLPNSASKEEMWNKILSLSESFEDINYIKNGIEDEAERNNTTYLESSLFKSIWLKFGNQRNINYYFNVRNRDGTITTIDATKNRLPSLLLQSVSNAVELNGLKNIPEVKVENLFSLFNSYGLYISKQDIAAFTAKDIQSALKSFKSFEQFVSVGENPFSYDKTKTTSILPAKNLIALLLKYSPSTTDNVIYTIHNKKEFTVQNTNFLTKSFDQIRSNFKEFANNKTKALLHSGLPIYKEQEINTKNWNVFYDNGFKDQGKRSSGVEYNKFTLKDLKAQNINFSHPKNNSNVINVMLPIFSDATSHAYASMTKIGSEYIPRQLAETAVAEIERIMFSMSTKTGFKNFDKNGKHFLLLPFLEKHKTELLELYDKKSDNVILIEKLNQYIIPELEKQYQNYLNSLVKLGIIIKEVTQYKDNNGKSLNHIKYKTTNAIDASLDITSNLEITLKEYFYNQYYYNTQLIPMLLGDPAFNKQNPKTDTNNPEISVSIDSLKRAKQIHTPTSSGSYVDAKGLPKRTKKILYLYDEEQASNNEFLDKIAEMRNLDKIHIQKSKDLFNKIKTNQELTKEDKQYKDSREYNYFIKFLTNNLTDAQKFNNPEFSLMVMEGHLKINAEERKTIRNQIKNNLKTDVTLEVTKPFVFSHEFIEVNGITLLRPFQEKNSEFTILPNTAYLTKDKTHVTPSKDVNWDIYMFPRMAKILWLMEGAGNPENTLDGISFESSMKIDTDTNTLMTLDDVLTLDTDIINPNVIESSMDGYGIANEVPADKQLNKTIDLGSQTKVLITEGIKEDVFVNGKKYTPKELADKFEELHILGHRENFKKLREKTNTPEKIINILKEAAIKLGKSVDSIMGYNKNIDGKVDRPIELDSTANQHIINSLTKATINESGPGGTFVNVSSILIGDNLEIKWKEDSTGKTIGIDHIECAAAINSPYIDALTDKYGVVTVKDVEDTYGKELADKLLTLVAYRIPTEDKYSIYPLKIKYILPRSSGAALMLPKEATTITGLDFDVDKMFFIKYAFKTVGNFGKYLGHINNIISEFVVQDNEDTITGLRDPETGNPYVLTTETFEKLFNMAMNEEAGNTLEEDAIIDLFKENLEDLKEILLKNKSLKLIESSEVTNSSRHNMKLDIMLEVSKTISFAKTFTIPGSSDILKKEVEIFSDPKDKYANYDIIEDESTAQLTSPNVQDENAKKANTGGGLIGIYANANKHHAIIEYVPLHLNKAFIFSKNFYTTIGDRRNKDNKKINTILASLLFASTEHIKTPLMDKLNINFDSVNALIAGIRLGVPFHELMVLINQPVIKESLELFSNSRNLNEDLTKRLNDLAKINNIDLKNVTGDNIDINISTLDTMFNVKDINNKVINTNTLIALNKFIELNNIGEELFQIQLNTKFDTANQFGPELLDNQTKLGRLKSLNNKLQKNSVFKNYNDVVSQVFYDKSTQLWSMNPSKLKLNDSYIQIMIDQLNHFKNTFSFLGPDFIKIQDEILEKLNKNFLFKEDIKKINGEIYNLVAQSSIDDITDIIVNVPKEWAAIKNNVNEAYKPFLERLQLELPFGKPLLTTYDNTSIGYALEQSYKDIFEEMLIDPLTREFAERLAIYAYFTSGFKYTSTGFSRFIPSSFLIENKSGKKIRDIYNNFDISLSDLDPSERVELIIQNNPRLANRVDLKEDVTDKVTKNIPNYGILTSAFILTSDKLADNEYLSTTKYMADGSKLDILYKKQTNMDGYYAAINLPGNSNLFSNYSKVDIGYYPDIAPEKTPMLNTTDIAEKEISTTNETMPVNDLDTAISYYEGDIKPEPNTIFVFGSNPEGRHGLGAAKTAVNKFGAKYGQGEGLQGNAYALPTKDLRITENNGFKSISSKQITENIVKLYEVAKQNPEKQFKIAYRNTTDKSLNGYTGLEMIEMFNNAGVIPLNIVFSKEWIDTGKLKQTVTMPVKDLKNIDTKNIPGYKEAMNLFLGIPEYTIDETLKNKDGSKRLANTKDSKITLNPVKSVEEFFDYFTGKEGGASSKQKEKVLKVLETKGYSLSKLKSILDSTYKIHQFLLLHEQSHIDNNDIDVYFKEGGDLLTDDKIEIEVRASIDALVKLDTPNLDIEIKNEKCK
jgi:hypothetical protein